MAHISITNSKLGSIPSVNLPPIVTCRRNAPCAGKKGCYACKGNFRFSAVQRNMLENLGEWIDYPRRYMQSIIDACTNVRFFRWHSAGDIPSQHYLAMMCAVAVTQPEVHFLAFTKQYELVDRFFSRFEKPDNLSIVYSAWGNLLPENPHNFPVAYVRLKSGEGSEHIPQDALPCSGACHMCIKHEQNCWKLKPGQSVCFDQH